MIHRLLSGLFHAVERGQAVVLNLVGGKSVGVRALVINEAGEFLLVRHTYRDGWHTPGGGVHKGESPHQAMARELREEAGLHMSAPPALFGVYHHVWRGRHDFPILFVVRDFEGQAHAADRFEIAEVAWFHPDRLPEGITEKTRARIMECVNGQTSGDVW